MTARRWLGVWLPGVGAALFLFVLAVRTGGGVFGTDEYWYAGDLRMTAATGGALSNHVYPLFADTVAPPRYDDGVARALIRRSLRTRHRAGGIVADTMPAWR